MEMGQFISEKREIFHYLIRVFTITIELNRQLKVYDLLSTSMMLSMTEILAVDTRNLETEN